MPELSNTACLTCGVPATVGTYTGNFCEACAARDVPRACDFCVICTPTWRYPCADFPVGAVPSDAVDLIHLHWSRGDWAACASCHALIDAGAWDALADRAASTMHAPDAARAAELRALTCALFGEFVRHRTGPPRPDPAPEERTPAP